MQRGRRAAACGLALWLSLGGPGTGAQTGRDGAERELLQQIVAEPVPKAATEPQLRQLFDRQHRAAVRLGDVQLEERILRQALQRLPRDSRWPNELAWILVNRGQHREAQAQFEAAMARAPTEADRLFFAGNRLSQLVVLGAADAAAVAEDLKRQATELNSRAGLGVHERITSLRALSRAWDGDASLAERQGRLGPALAARVEAERWARAAYDATRASREVSANLRFVAASSLADLKLGRVYLLARLGRTGEAAALLEEHLGFVREHALPGTAASHAVRALAYLHLQQGRWADGERELRRSIALLDNARVPRSHPWQIGRQANLVMALWMAGRLDDAQAVLTELDALQRSARLNVSRVRLPFERGLVELSRGRPREAAGLFTGLAEGNERSFGLGAFFTAQARALQGAAMWATQDPALRDAASDLLKDALLDMLAPRNADLFDDHAIRRPVRELIFRSYLEAAAWRGGLQAMVAMGVADRLATTGAARAVADAAVRAAASDPALAELVRLEQDLRQQIEALRGDGSQTPDDDARRRLSDLELQRQQAQERIRARFPEYDRLLHPALANPTEVAQRLRRDEVLLLAVPTAKTLYLWAVNADELPAFAKVAVTEDQLIKLVQRVRAGVDFDLNGGRVGRFDHAAAAELHRLVLGPVAARLQGRQHLIVAAGGPLARLPFALLPEAAGADPAWLVRRLAISQVPTVSAWLSLRQAPSKRAAPRPLLAWADPSFAGPRAKAPTRGGERDYGTLPPLPESRDEARAVARALKADPDRDVIVGEQATRDSVLEASRSGRLSQARVLMFATHGLTPGDLPGVQQPGLALAAVAGDSDPNRFIVGLDDVLGMRLNAEWVVLSACNTAGDDGRAQEALSGLARGFLYAGARSLMVSHWAVETESAKQLTTRTFEHQASHPTAARAESLRQAMLELMAQPKYAHPAYWAPFALVGEGGR